MALRTSESEGVVFDASGMVIVQEERTLVVMAYSHGLWPHPNLLVLREFIEQVTRSQGMPRKYSLCNIDNECLVVRISCSEISPPQSISAAAALCLGFIFVILSGSSRSLTLGVAQQNC